MVKGIREATNRSIILAFIVGFGFGIVGFGIYPSMIWTVLNLVVVVWLIMIRFGKLRWSDIGLRRDKLLEGILFTVALWAIWQGIEVLTGLAAGKSLALNADVAGTISDPSQRFPFENFILSVLFFALSEEIFYRGYLIPQFAVRLRRRFPARSEMFSVLVAVLISSAIFAVAHVVVRLQNGITVAQLISLGDTGLPSLFLRGLLFSFVFVRTGNLFAGLGVHALSNAMPMLFLYRSDALLGVIMIGALLALVWPNLWRLRPNPVSASVANPTG